MIVGTSKGSVRGRRCGSGHAFSAIPYAAPPTARFAAPQPHPGWDGVRDATRPGPTAPMPEHRLGRLDMRPFLGPGWVRGDDHLTVNVWTPDAATRGLPVMVFVHGGGFVAGSARGSLYDGESFARDGVVLVTLNYRLGVPGWLSVPGRPDNRGLLDVLMALQWVQEEISAFGGDPDNVTLFGQSAGAMITAAALADPAARGLFRRAISQSGSGTGSFAPAQAELLSSALARDLGVRRDDIPEIPDERLLAALGTLAPVDPRVHGLADPFLGIARLGPVLERPPAEVVAAGAGCDVDLVVGTTEEEANLYLADQHSTMDDVRVVAAQAHPDPDRLIAAYREQRPDASAGELRSAIWSDGVFGAGSRSLADAHSAHPAATYRYEFAWPSPALEGQLGASHGVELPFVFDRAHDPELHGPEKLLGEPEAPAELARAMHSAWISFATNGDPGWPQHVLPQRRTMRFAEESAVVNDPRPVERAAWYVPS